MFQNWWVKCLATKKIEQVPTGVGRCVRFRTVGKNKNYSIYGMSKYHAKMAVLNPFQISPDFIQGV
jgi:hypothetical protein